LAHFSVPPAGHLERNAHPATSASPQYSTSICLRITFSGSTKYLHTTVERVLSAEEYERAQEHGLPNLLEMPESGAPAFARFVVRDRATGNLGSIDVVNPLPGPVEAMNQRHAKAPLGSIRAFGSVVPSPASFCGDVYELPEATSGLPDFWNMDPIGSLYVSSLNVPNQDITETTGIPGVTSRVDWFGIDYHGEFRIATPGEYEFKMSSDDGAELYIDDDLVIDTDGVHPILTKRGRTTLSAGRHTIHVAYFQGPPLSLALVLEIKPPAARKFEILDLKDFSQTADEH
jgi:PA14 domain